MDGSNWSAGGREVSWRNNTRRGEDIHGGTTSEWLEKDEMRAALCFIYYADIEWDGCGGTRRG
jgi:hypothetical protein